MHPAANHTKKSKRNRNRMKLKKANPTTTSVMRERFVDPVKFLLVQLLS